MNPIACLAVLSLFAAAACSPVEKSPEKPADATPAPTPVAAAGKVFLPTDLDALRPLVGQPITIEGRLVRLGGNKGQTIRYLNFTQNYRDSVALVFFVSKGGDAFAKDKLTEWLGKKVRATGKLADFNGNLQIEVENLDQLQEIAETPPPAAAAAKTL
jgi:hypothetical protein